jgi:NAD(P)-dependent dehydrogenase (short-subunit alcohol dehydrogenase family)
MSTTAFHLTGKTILVTGASSGIGRAVALECAAMGATLVITGRNKTKLDELLHEIGEGHITVVADLLDTDSLANLIANLPLLDGMVNCAGVVHPFPIVFLNKKKIDDTLLTNFYAATELTAALFKARKVNDSASLVYMSSISGQHPHKGGGMYAASKAAIEAFSKTVALEYQHKKVRSNCICPAMVKTPMFDGAMEQVQDESMNKHLEKYPLGVGMPEDVARAAVFLLSPAARWITGTNLTMDGGLLLQY